MTYHLFKVNVVHASHSRRSFTPSSYTFLEFYRQLIITT